MCPNDLERARVQRVPRLKPVAPWSLHQIQGSHIGRTADDNGRALLMTCTRSLGRMAVRKIRYWRDHMKSLATVCPLFAERTRGFFCELKTGRARSALGENRPMVAGVGFEPTTFGL